MSYCMYTQSMFQLLQLIRVVTRRLAYIVHEAIQVLWSRFDIKKSTYHLPGGITSIQGVCIEHLGLLSLNNRLIR